MKFGESLSEGLVPEWQDQYLDYKKGKKLIKKIVQLKEESELVSTIKASSDRIPLLNPAAIDQNNQSYTNEISDENIHDHNNTLSVTDEGANKPHFARRPSIFNYSLRSKEKDKKDDYEKERSKFSTYLDSELEKVDSFFKEKEHEAYERYLLIQDQLYQLRDHKASIAREKTRHSVGGHPDDSDVYGRVNDLAYHTKTAFTSLNKLELPSLPSMTFLKKFKRKPKASDLDTQMIDYNPNDAENRIRNGEVDINATYSEMSSIDSEDSSSRLGIPDRTQPQTVEQQRQAKRRDYTVKKQHFGVPYLYARKQLKIVVLEHYRALSLLRSFKTLNRTAFRKITKKFDKALKSNLLDSYMKKIDSESYFQTSDLVDKLTNHVEELFIAFFDPETTDRKHSLEKLKSIAYAMNNNDIRQPSYYQSFFSSGFFLGFGIPLAILGIYTALRKIFRNDLPEGPYMLQIWGGFFLLNLMLILFGINLAVFDMFKINYKFIFEFDMSSVLNYKQYWLLPSFGFTFLSILVWFSFNNFWPTQFPGRDWAWIYFTVMLALFLWPGNHFYGSSRKWLQVAIWRLLLSGFYPVEFRDFFLGDIFCSLTYTMGNLSFFFCLYAHHWNGLLGDGHDSSKYDVCGSSKSRLMGFFSTLPSIWRFLQCVRRYMDTGDWFPHLANMLKYSISALYYCLLSVYRIERIERNRAAFIAVAVINSIYSATWDIVMDWSLLQSGSKHPYLRDNLFFKNPNYYYFAMISDIILRFQWIFYAFFSNQIQQSAVTSFCIALAEIIRRFIWIFFRMENEHCTNVVLFRASKDSPLPYAVSSKVEKAIKKLANARYVTFVSENENVLERLGTQGGGSAGDSSYSSSRQTIGDNVRRDDESSLGLGRYPSGASALPQLSRRKSTFTNISDTLNKAHIKDFQRRKTVINMDDDSDDEDDDAASIRRSHTSTRNASKLPSVTEDDEA